MMDDLNPFADGYSQSEPYTEEVIAVSATASPITYHADVTQGSLEWLQCRLGLLTASEMKLILTPTLKIAANDKQRTHLHELLAQRITRHVEPMYVSDDMLRGQTDEILARDQYSKNYAPVQEVGFITNSQWGFTIGYSPDGLVGDDGLIEIKSRRAKFQVESILNAAMPDDYLMQAQTGLLVTGRKWLDFVSYCGGMPMMTVRVYPDERIQAAIIEAATVFERAMDDAMHKYTDALASGLRLIPTERTVEVEMF